MLMSLMDGRARTGTELAALAEVGPSTASVHLHRLEAARLVAVRRQGKNRYYTLGGAQVAGVLEKLAVVAGRGNEAFLCKAPEHLRMARTCYDHLAGTVGVALRDQFTAFGWLAPRLAGDGETYEVTASGARALTGLGIDLEAARHQRRRFAFGCLDWSERRYHLGGALGAAVLRLAQQRRWVVPHLDSRALRITRQGWRELANRLGVSTSTPPYQGALARRPAVSGRKQAPATAVMPTTMTRYQRPE
jgi:DNA-binding transcriptional ArsR family regulator